MAVLYFQFRPEAWESFLLLLIYSHHPISPSGNPLGYFWNPRTTTPHWSGPSSLTWIVVVASNWPPTVYTQKAARVFEVTPLLKTLQGVSLAPRRKAQVFTIAGRAVDLAPILVWSHFVLLSPSLIPPPHTGLCTVIPWTQIPGWHLVPAVPGLGFPPPDFVPSLPSGF